MMAGKKGDKKSNKEDNFIGKLFIVYEEILKLEKNFGKYIPIKFLKSSLLKRNKKKYRISINELKKILDKLSILGIIFVPKGGFVQRAFTLDWKDAKNK